MNESLRRFGVYEVLDEIGAGGTGTVYRARDSRLDRLVAIKVLTHPGVDDSERRRLDREARTVSSLNHPHICALYDIGYQEGVPFLVMEYVEGETLAERAAAGPLPLHLALSTAIKLADAMAFAHRSGVVHRDIKPQNVILTKTGPKLLDFGIAKRTHADGGPGMPSVTTTLIEEGKIVGTLQYMAPEQLRNGVTDARSDIFSFGALLYEILTGRAAFAANSPAGVIAAILDSEPPPLTGQSGVVLPSGLERIVRKCLSKDPDQRWQSAQDLCDELQWFEDSHRAALEVPPGVESRHGTVILPPALTTRRRTTRIATASVVVLMAIGAVAGRLWYTRRSTDGPIDSLAVLPFVNVGADENTEYLSDGITENLINSLSRLPRLRVVPRSRVFRYKGREAEPETVGRELNVLAVLTGRVIQRGDALNIQTELVDVAGDSQLWGRQYDRRSSEIIAVQEEIATEVAERLRLKPTIDEQKRITRRYTENPEAHHLYLKGRYLWNRRTAETVRRATQYFQQAIERDPGYALAWAGLADCYGVYGIYGVLPNRESIPLAEHAAMKALEIDDTLAEAHASIGYAKGYDWDWTGAEKEFQRAIQLNPDYPTAHHWYATNVLEPMGRLDQAMAEVKRAQDLDPLSLVIDVVVARDFFFARRYDRAIDQLRKTLELDPNFALAHSHLGLVYEQTGMLEQAVAEFQKWLELSRDEPSATAALGHAYAISGRRAEAQKALVTLKDLSRSVYVAPYDVAVVYAGLGDRDQAMAWLGRAYEDHSAWLIWIRADPRFDGIRDDPRYHDLLRRMRIPE
jgi:eukaryotic-like serine/threonine-protein kinase